MSRRSFQAAPIGALVLAWVASCAAPPRPPAEAVAIPGIVGAAASDEAEPASLPMRPPRPLDADGAFYVQAQDPARPQVRYLDGQTSANDSCPILRGNKLSRKVPPMYVNGRPIGFC